MVSLYRISEECKQILGDRVSVQSLIPSVIEAYAYVAKKIWFENTKVDEETQVDGAFENTFTNVMPSYDKDRDLYYIVIPSTYLMLPHQSGITWVAGMKDKSSFIKVSNWGIYSTILASAMGGLQVYQVEGSKMYFPKMTKPVSKFPLLLKLAIAYDKIDPYEQLNIAPNIIVDIKQIVTAPLMSKEDPINKIREIIN